MRRSLFIFGVLEDTDIDWVASKSEVVTLAAGQPLIEAGRELESIFILLSGRAEVVSPSGTLLAIVQSGDILGEMSMIDDAPPSATVRIGSDAEVVRTRKSVLREKLEADTGFAARFYKGIATLLSQRMRDTISSFGYGPANEANLQEPDELDPSVLDHLHLAGSRFERLAQAVRH